MKPKQTQIRVYTSDKEELAKLGSKGEAHRDIFHRVLAKSKSREGGKV